MKLGKYKIGALPIGFKGTILNVKFKIINQFDIYGNVTAIFEDTQDGTTILTISNNTNTETAANVLFEYVKQRSLIDSEGEKFFKNRIKKFVINISQEVKAYNSGKTKTEKRKPLVIKEKIKTMPTKKKAAKKVAKRFVKGSKEAKLFMARLRAKKGGTKKRVTHKEGYQYGDTNKIWDKRVQAKKSGKRLSKNKNVYYEYRANRTDKGKLLGIGSLTIDKFTRVKEDIAKAKMALAKFEAYKKNPAYKHLRGSILIDIRILKNLIKEFKVHERELKKLL